MRTLAEIVPLRTPACREAVDAVSMLAAGEHGVDSRAGSHVASCLRCQAEVAAYRRVLATMRSMREELVPAPDGAVSEALEAMQMSGWHFADGSPPWAVRVAYVGGITAAGAAGMLMWLGRRRLGLPHAS